MMFYEPVIAVAAALIAASCAGVRLQDVRDGPGCSYVFNVPEFTGTCGPTNNQFHGKVDELRIEFGETILYFDQRNSFLGEQIQIVEKSTKDQDKQMAVLKNAINEVMSFQNSFVNTDDDFKLAYKQRTNNFDRMLKEMNIKLVDMVNSITSDAVEQSKRNAALEIQIRSGEQRASRVEDRIGKLVQIINDIKNRPISRPVSSTFVLNHLQDQIIQFEHDLNFLNNSQHAHYEKLLQTSNILAKKINHQSVELLTVNKTAADVQSRLKVAENNNTLATRTLATLRINTNKKLDKLTREMSNVTGYINTLDNEILNIATQAMDAKVTVGHDKKGIDKLNTTIISLSTSLSNIMKRLKTQNLSMDHLLTELHHMDPHRFDTISKTFESLGKAASLGSEMHAVQKELILLSSVVEEIKKHGSTILKVPTLPPLGSSASLPFKVPTLPSITSGPGVLPTTPSTSSPSQPPPFKVPTSSSLVGPFGFKIPTLPPLSTTLVSVMKGSTSSSSTLPFKVPTLFQTKNTPGFIVPTFIQGGSSSGLGFKIQTISSGLRIPTKGRPTRAAAPTVQSSVVQRR